MEVTKPKMHIGSLDTVSWPTLTRLALSVYVVVNDDGDMRMPAIVPIIIRLNN